MIKKRKKINNTSFLRKVFLSFLVFSIIICFSLTTILSLNFYNILFNMTQKYSDSLLQKNNYSITYMNDLARKITDSLYSNIEVTAFLNADELKPFSTIVAGNTVKANIFPLTYVESVYLYNAANDIILSTRNGVQYSLDKFDDPTIKKLLSDTETLKTTGSTPVVHTINYGGKASNICSYIIYTPQKDGNGIKNALVVNINSDTLTSSIETINENDKYKTNIFVLDRDYNVIGAPPFSQGKDNDIVTQRIKDIIINDQLNEMSSIKVDDSDFFTIVNTDNANGWYVVGLIPKSNLESDMTYAIIISIIINAFILIISAFLCALLAKKLNFPVLKITQYFKGEAIQDESAIATADFQYIYSQIVDMKKQNASLMNFQNDAAESIKNNYLESLVLGKNIYSPDNINEKLHELDLSYITTNHLCMCIFKIDSINKFVESTSPKERDALCYAVINIAREVFLQSFHCDMLRNDQDKFIVILDCKNLSPKDINKKIEAKIKTIQQHIGSNLLFTVSCAYSMTVGSYEQLPWNYNNLLEALKLKIHLGHQAIINSNINDSINFDSFVPNISTEDSLIEKILQGNSKKSLEIYQKINDRLNNYNYSYNEIVNYLIHLLYKIVTSTDKELPVIKEEILRLFNDTSAQLSSCEIFEDYTNLLSKFIKMCCFAVKDAKENSTSEANDMINDIVALIESNYKNTDLCLNTIASKLGLSSNYVGLLFKREKNESISKYISDYRMNKVAYLLKTTNYSINKILESVGLEKTNYFYTAFKKYFGMSLSDYKEKIELQKQDENR